MTVPGGSITGNNLVWRKITFPAVTTSQIRVVVNGSADGFSRLTEVEAYTAGNGNTPPSVSLTAPANGAVYSGPATVTLAASATDSDGTVSKVEFYNGSTLLGSAVAVPYSYTWSNVLPGSYSLKARAYDNQGATSDSSPVSLTVNDTTLPTVSLTAPGNATTVSGTITISASASDNVGVSRVEFYQNGILLSATNVAPYGYNWNTSFLANGSYNLTAKAFDAAGNVGQSGTVSVTVANSDTTPPTISITAPSNTAIVSGTVSISASASDNVGVSRVEFYQNGVLLATTAAPYSYIWNTTTVANGSYLLTAKAYDAAGNVGQSANVTVSVSNLSGQRVNVALQANGGVATASSSYSDGNYPPTGANNGDRKGLNWGSPGCAWNDNTPNAFPDWLQIAFSGQQSINEVDVFTLQDNFANPVDPTPTLTFSNHGVTAFDVQYWNGSAWVTVPGGSITGNNLVWRKITFPALTTSQIRVVVNGSTDGWSRITEIEAYTP